MKIGYLVRVRPLYYDGIFTVNDNPWSFIPEYEYDEKKYENHVVRQIVFDVVKDNRVE